MTTLSGSAFPSLSNSGRPATAHDLQACAAGAPPARGRRRLLTDGCARCPRGLRAPEPPGAGSSAARVISHTRFGPGEPIGPEHPPCGPCRCGRLRPTTWRPAMAATDLLGEEHADHLLRRAGFGPRPGEVEKFAAKTRENAVDELLGGKMRKSRPPSGRGDFDALRKMQRWWLQQMRSPEVAPPREDDAVLARPFPEQLQRHHRSPLDGDPERHRSARTASGTSATSSTG